MGRKKEEVFGWSVFNSDSLYKAYEKRCHQELKVDSELYQAHKDNPNPNFVPNEDALNRLSQSVINQ